MSGPSDVERAKEQCAEYLACFERGDSLPKIIGSLRMLLSDHDRLTRELREARKDTPTADAVIWRQEANKQARRADLAEAEAADLRAKLDAEKAESERLRGLFLSMCDSRDAWIKQCDAAEARLAELQRIINDDGSLTTHEEHVDILRDAMSALNGIAELQRENERLKSEATGWELAMHDSMTRTTERAEKAEAALAAEREWRERLEKALRRIADDDMTRAEPHPEFILRDDGPLPNDAPQFTYHRDTPRSLAREALRPAAQEPQPSEEPSRG